MLGDHPIHVVLLDGASPAISSETTTGQRFPERTDPTARAVHAF